LTFTGKLYFRILGLGLSLGLESGALALHVSGLGLGLLALTLTPLTLLTFLLCTQQRSGVFNERPTFIMALALTCSAGGDTHCAEDHGTSSPRYEGREADLD